MGTVDGQEGTGQEEKGQEGTRKDSSVDLEDKQVKSIKQEMCI